MEQRSPAVSPEFAAVRDRAKQDWEDDRREQFNEEYYAALRARYEVVIEDEDAGDYAAASGDAR